MKKLVLLFAFVGSMAFAQTGLVNTDYILASMTEMQNANAEIQKLSKMLSEDLAKAEQNAQAKMQDLKYKASAPDVTEDQMKQFANQAQAMQQELMANSRRSEEKVAAKREQLLTPILDRVNKAIQDVAATKGYKLVMNANSVLYAAEGTDITEDVASKLGVTLLSGN